MRIEIGDGERPGDERARARAAPRPDRNALRLRPFDEVGDDEEIAGELHVDDDVELEGEALCVVLLGVSGGEPMRGEARAQALARLTPELLLLVESDAAGNRKARQDRLSRRGPIGAAHGDLDAGLGRLGQIGEQFGHFRARLEPMLGRQAPALGRRHHRAFGDAEQRVMRFVIRRPGEIGLVGRDQGQAGAIGESDQLRLDRALAVEPVALDLDIEPRAEDIGQPLEPALGQVAKACSQRPVDRPAGAAGQRDEALRVFQRGEGKMRIVAVLGIEPQSGDEAHQMAVAGLVLRQENDRRARIVPLDAAPEGGGRVGEIDRHLRADDRLHAALGELLGKFERAEQIVGVGDRQRRHGVGLGELGQRLDRQRALAQRIGAVHVQMHEADGFDDRRVHAFVVASARRAGRGRRGRALWMTPSFGSRADGAGDERDHDQERPEGGDLGDVAQRVSGDGVHLGLLDLYKFMICSLLVRVQLNPASASSEPDAWLT